MREFDEKTITQAVLGRGQPVSRSLNGQVMSCGYPSADSPHVIRCTVSDCMAPHVASIR